MTPTITLTPTRDGMMDITCAEPHLCQQCGQMRCWFRNRHGRSACIFCIDREEGQP